MRGKWQVVPLDQIKLNLFVRQSLNEDHALYLAELMENGVDLPPIKVASDFTVIDGRHRVEAHVVNMKKEIRCEVLDLTDETEIISEAYKANTGGSLPPTREDTEHTIMLLLERKESKKRIGELLGLPPGLARRYISEVQSRTNRAKLQRAAAAVTDGGLTVAKAAESHEVDLEKLKEILSVRRRKHKHGVAEMQRALTKTYKSLGSKNASALRRLLEKYDDGDVTEKQVRDIFSHLEDLQKKQTRSTTDWKHRFDALNKKAKVA